MERETTPPPALSAWLAAAPAAAAFTALGDALSTAAVFAVDRDQRVVYWSAGAEALLGFTAEEMVGEHCLKGNRCTECMAGCGVRERAAIEGRPLTLHKKQGGQVRVAKHARSLRDEEGRFFGGVEVLIPLEATPEPSPAVSLAVAPDSGVESFHGLITRAPPMKQLFAVVRNVASTDVTVLVRGESGSGKELFARAIHEESNRKKGPFLAVNCAAMSPALLESELFGHEKGAFTGAHQVHRGVFERADQGTLFLDEVAELPFDLQAKLLRVLEERTFFRVGGTKPVTTSVRIVSATHRSLRREVAAGRFREDLMYRLRVVPLFIPPLRERTEDLPLLIDQLVAQLNARGPRRIRDVAPDAMRVLLGYAWPGNVRELKNSLEYAFAVARGETLTLEDLPRDLSEGGPPGPAAPPAQRQKRLSDDEEKIRIVRALAETDGNIGEAATRLGMSRPTLWRKRKRLGL